MVNLILGVTGSVASIKLPVLLQSLRAAADNIEIKIIATTHSFHFFDQLSIDANIYNDDDEWQAWKQKGDPVLHIELRKWADIMLIAPLDANTLAKIANGICDNLLTCLMRAWDLKRPVIFCPAMNTHMWKHPITSNHIAILKNFGYIEVEPIEKRLACGDTGIGAMADIEKIVAVVMDILSQLDTIR
ncbi:Phosphopantothenoylcysteine decarboxylase [Trichoplax sp. H2]|uniref:Phosphopantothenoylcysteine decarboxylase n=1 Tax=Trichoplax adhaerens TaxID=10228 RepID=B3RR71_TRIAD|nr:hypothetical protein TRIADDRAFT_49959 [Trichoplax adhaerens]EDV26292.1 hypothetical protein TRIADDRAFT_49959 [Trichoplax adhaerens]RDD45196.1 Phosphopantothenoylcysteine decarboxylase [Trichoplax sp. H2]|eukprot:XP_002110288.1 hypothetical protein TRIADDRAFT_49959 [Trichoplax adhaerens]